MAWYRAGTVAVTNGSAVVTGTGTAFVANVQAGHAINLPDGKAYEVAAVNSDTQITLGSAYLGSTATGQAYSVQPNQGFAQQAASMLANFLALYGTYAATALSGRFTDGTVASPGISFSADQDTGLTRVGANAQSLVCGGAQIGTFNSTGMVLTGSLAITSGVSCGGTVQINGGNSIQFYNAAAGTDAKYARLYTSPIGHILLDFVNDAYSAGYPALQIVRSGAAPIGTILYSNVYASADNTYSNGTAANRWTGLFAASGTIQTSDATAKTKPTPIDDVLLDAWTDVQWVQFQFLSAVEEKGAGRARIHWGVIAQQVRDALAAHGIDGLRYGVLCYDRWEEQPEVREPHVPGASALLNEVGDVLVEAIPPVPERVVTQYRAAGELWGIRYDLAQAIEAAFQRRRADRLDSRLTAIEARLAA